MSEPAGFIQRIESLPSGPVSLDAALKPALADEAELRRLFAFDKANPRVQDLHTGLVDVFAAPPGVRTTHARVVKREVDLGAKHIMPLSAAQRREEGAPATVASLDEFKKNWALFTEGALGQIQDWSNVVAAGGAVQACLAPLPDSAKESECATGLWYHDKAYTPPDVDLFLYGLTPEQVRRHVL